MGVYTRSGISSQSPYFKLILLGVLCLFIYFIWMDIALFVNLQRWSPPPIESTSTSLRTTTTRNATIKLVNTKIDPFTVFNPLTVKLVMIDHMTHYVHDIVARFLVDFMGLAAMFPWMSANIVSFLGVVSALIGSYLMVSDHLMYRQVGALLFECRNIADSLDGVFARARKREYAQLMASQNIKVEEPTFASGAYGSFGYNVDVIADIIGGAFFVAAIFYRFSKRPPRSDSKSQSQRAMRSLDQNNNNKMNSKYTKLEMDEIPLSAYSSSSSINDLEVNRSKVSDSVKEAFATPDDSVSNTLSRNVSSRQVKLICFSFAMRILLTGYIWDRFVHKYQDLIMDFSSNPTQRKFQAQAFKSISLWMIMWSWRLINGCALLEHLTFATFFDKLWEYLVFTTYIGWAFLFVLTMVTELHFTELQYSLNRLSAFT